MSVSIHSSTNLSLLAKLIDTQSHEEIWPVFVGKYGKAIYAWCLKWGASPEDAEDIVQQTLLTVFLKVEMFTHRGRYTFRNWLRQIARHTWLRIVEKSSRSKVLDSQEIDRLISISKLKTALAREDLINSFDQLACDELRDLAYQRVQDRVSPQTWQAYIMHDHGDLSGELIASQLEMSHVAVRLSAYRVRIMLLQEIAKIDPNDDKVES